MYLFRRATFGLLVLLAISALTFVLTNLAPGAFFDEMRVNPRISAETIQAQRTAYGLDRPLPVRYLRWLESALKGDWGTSVAYHSAAGPILMARAKNTLLLGGVATLIAWLIALPVGLWIASKRNGLLDLGTSLAIAGLMAVPEIILCLLVLACASATSVLPAGGMAAVNSSELGFLARCRDVAAHLCLPVLVLTLALLPLLLSQIRAAIAQVLDASFILAARAHGITAWRLVVVHALRAAANPLLSLLGLSIGLVLSSSIVVEGVFSWPGLGQLLIQAISQRDLDLVVDATLLSAVFVVTGNLLADVLLYTMDPRIRTTGR